MLRDDYKQPRPWLSAEDLKKMTRASELFLWLGSCPSSTTNHFGREDSNPHKSQQLYWLSRLIYVTRRDVDSKHPQRSAMSENIAQKKKLLQYFPSPKIPSGSINTTVTSLHYNFSEGLMFMLLAPSSFVYLNMGSSEGQAAGWCNVCRNQDGGHGGEVKH